MREQWDRLTLWLYPLLAALLFWLSRPDRLGWPAPVILIAGVALERARLGRWIASKRLGLAVAAMFVLLGCGYSVDAVADFEGWWRTIAIGGIVGALVVFVGSSAAARESRAAAEAQEAGGESATE